MRDITDSKPGRDVHDSSHNMWTASGMCEVVVRTASGAVALCGTMRNEDGTIVTSRANVDISSTPTRRTDIQTF